MGDLDPTVPDSQTAARWRDPESELALGDRVGDYVVRGMLSSGGFGSVLRVEHVDHGTVAALKALHPEHASSGESQARFEREVRALNTIRHPNVVEVFDIGQLADGRPFYVMELLEGQDLQSHLRERNRIAPTEAADILAPLCDALGAAHELAIVHRDVKASNVFIAAPGKRVVLLDFGVAKMRAGTPIDLTRTDQAIGTPECISPEQIGAAPVDHRADIYALGALTYRMLTGRAAFSDPSIEKLHYLHCNAPRPRPSMLVDLAPAIDAVVVRAMAVSAADRFASTAEFLAAFRDAFTPADVKSAAAEIAIHVEAYADLAEPDEALLDAIDAVLEAARDECAAAGMESAGETDVAAQWVAPLGSDPVATRDRMGALATRLRERIASTLAGADRPPDLAPVIATVEVLESTGDGEWRAVIHGAASSADAEDRTSRSG